MSSLSTLLFTSVGLFFGLSLAGCNPTVTGCEAPDSGGAELPDPSFEESPTQWVLAPHSTIDSEKAVCEGSHSLKVQLDSGAGSAEVTRSPTFTGVKPDREYEMRFQFRYENCKNAELQLKIGNYERLLKFEGVDGSWKDTTFTVTFGADPVWIDLRPQREGTDADFQGSEFDNNLMWLDDFTIEDIGPAN